MKIKLLLVLTLVLAVALRVYKIDNSVADWHSWRQADTASVTREFIKHGIDLLHPTYHDLSNIPSGKENLSGYRMVEFPLLNGLTAFVAKTLHVESRQVLVGRWVSIVFSLITIISLYWFGSQISGPMTGYLGAFLFAVLPFSVYYSRVILPDPALITMTTLSMALFTYYLRQNKFIFLVLSMLSFTAALLFKPYAAFSAPVYFALIFVYKKYFKALPTLILFALSALPMLWWRKWILQYPAGIPASDWLYNNLNIRFKGAFFHWLFDVRLSNLILGVGGMVPFVLGLLKKGKDSLIYITWGLSMFAYLAIFAGGNVQHDYYQIVLLPFVCLTAARGFVFLWELSPQYISRFAALMTILVLILFSVFVSWYTIRGYYQVNNYPIVLAGQAVDRLTSPDAKVIAPYMGDTAFLFQTNRTGWPIGYFIDDKIKMGATVYVTVSYDDEAHAMEKLHPTIEKTKDYLILDLTK